MNHYTTSIQGTLVKQPVFHRKSCHDFQLVAKSKVGFNSSRLLFLSLRGGRELPGLFGVCTELCVHGALHVAMALRTLGGESDPKISCFDGFWSGPKTLMTGGGNSNMFYFYPDPCGKCDQIWRAFFFRWVGSTTNQAGDLLFFWGLNNWILPSYVKIMIRQYEDPITPVSQLFSAIYKGPMSLHFSRLVFGPTPCL